MSDEDSVVSSHELVSCKNIDISHIKGLLCILLEDTSQFDQFIEENQLDLPSHLNRKWLEKVSSKLSKETDMSCGTYTRGVPQKLLYVLRECVLMHRWCEASQILAVSHRETTCDLHFATWKVGMEILYSEFQRDGFVSAERLMKLLDMLRNPTLFSSYMHAEYLLYQSMLDDPEKAVRVISTTPSVNKLYQLEESITKEKYFYNMLLAYHGLLWYKLWIKTIASHNVNSQSSLGISFEHVASSYSDKMTECFLSFYQDSEDSSGVRDAIIVPHVRTLEHYQKFDDAKQLLQKYRSLNPQNPNAHKYYYNFLCRTNSGVEERIDILKALAAHVPSDPLVLTLCEHLQTKEDLPSCVTYLFDLLDHDCWKKKPAPWKKLVGVLEKLSSVDNSLSETLNPLWSQRRSWWPPYHFLPISVPRCVQDSDDKDLYVTKMILALFLMDPQLDSYIKAVEKLTNDEDKAKMTSVKMFISKSN